MNHFQVLKRAWEITWRYRVLWVFGIILALTTSRGGGGGGPQYSFSGEDVSLPGGRLIMSEIPPEVIGALIAIGVGLACLIVILVVVSVVARYVAETALIRLVNDHEETGERQNIRQGFRMGWSRAAWRLFLIDLLIGIPVAFAFILLFLVALVPLLLWTTGSNAAGALGTVATVGLIFLLILLGIIVAIVLTLLIRFFRRVCVLEDLGVIESIRQGLGMVRHHLKDVAIMWLIMAGVSMGLGLAMFIVLIGLLVAAVLLGGLPALLVGGLAGLFFEGPAPWILAAAVGLPVFLVVLIVPLLFLSGVIEVFKSSLWTLTYRELRALEGMKPKAS